MRIENDKIYRMRKWFFSKDETQDYGQLTGKDIKSILRGCKYDETFDMWFTEKATIGYELMEVE